MQSKTPSGASSFVGSQSEAPSLAVTSKKRNDPASANPTSYADVYGEAERQYSAYNFEHANTEMLFRHFGDAEQECAQLVAAELPLPAYDQCIKASHIFNLLDARGVISVTERAAFIGRVRDLAKACATAWLTIEGELPAEEA